MHTNMFSVKTASNALHCIIFCIYGLSRMHMKIHILTHIACTYYLPEKIYRRPIIIVLRRRTVVGGRLDIAFSVTCFELLLFAQIIFSINQLEQKPCIYVRQNNSAMRNTAIFVILELLFPNKQVPVFSGALWEEFVLDKTVYS